MTTAGGGAGEADADGDGEAVHKEKSTVSKRLRPVRLAEVAREVLAAGIETEVIGLSTDAVCSVARGSPPGVGREVDVAEGVPARRRAEEPDQAGADGSSDRGGRSAGMRR